MSESVNGAEDWIVDLTPFLAPTEFKCRHCGPTFPVNTTWDERDVGQGINQVTVCGQCGRFLMAGHCAPLENSESEAEEADGSSALPDEAGATEVAS